MQLFIRDTSPQRSAHTLCNAHVCSQARETMQILSTLLWLWGVVPKGPVDVGDDHVEVYKPAYPKHPCVLWAAACQAHARWTYQHAKALCAEFTLRHNGEQKHLCEYHVDHWWAHILKHGWPKGMPGTITPQAWLCKFDDEARAGLDWRVASVNPPDGCKFGIIALDMIGPRRGSYDDCLASYDEYYMYKEHFSFKKPMQYGEYSAAAKKRKRDSHDSVEAA